MTSPQIRRGAVFCIGLSIAGLILSGYLGFLHLALMRGELFGGRICGDVGSVFNCHAVSAHRLSQLLGMPMAFWGLIGYLATLGLSAIAWRFQNWADQALISLVGLSGVFLGIDLLLFAIMVTQVGYLCSLCLFTYLVNVLLLVVAKQSLALPWMRFIRQLPAAVRVFLPGSNAFVTWIFWSIVLTGAAGVVAVNASAEFLSQTVPGGLRGRMAAYVRSVPRVDVDTKGDPLLGIPVAPIRIVEFTDFLCPVCQEAARFNAVILANHRRQAVFYLKHFPLDKECNSGIEHSLHPGACRLAAAAECAQEQGKFWHFHDRIFRKGHGYLIKNLEMDASEAGLDVPGFLECMNSGRGMEAVRKDVQEGVRLGLIGTPAYVVNGVLIRGAITPVAFEELLKALADVETTAAHQKAPKGRQP